MGPRWWWIERRDFAGRRCHIHQPGESLCEGDRGAPAGRKQVPTFHQFFRAGDEVAQSLEAHYRSWTGKTSFPKPSMDVGATLQAIRVATNLDDGAQSRQQPDSEHGRQVAVDKDDLVHPRGEVRPAPALELRHLDVYSATQ
jgi:hypothetical protein